MGLDGYLYRTSKKRIEAQEQFGEIRKEYSKDIETLVSKPKWRSLMDSLPKDEFGHYDWKSYTKEQKIGMRNLRRAARRVAKKHGLCLDRALRPIFDLDKYGLTSDDDIEEIGYWRKNWDLHNYIIDNFGDKEHDNLCEIYFSKVALEKIVNDGHVGGFANALERWDDDHVVYYWPWY